MLKLSHICFAFLFVLFCKNAVVAQTKPNIILVFADDLGYKDCGFTGSKKFETPVIDGLAAGGIVFTQAYAAAGNCAPSRAGLMSGLYAPRHGVYAVGSTMRGPKDQMRLEPVKNTNSLRPDIKTMAEALKEKGYTTGLFGKWHLGYGEDTKPTAQGFDKYIDTRYPNPNKKRNIPNDPKGIFSLTDSAIAFMGATKQKPFFVFLSHHAIHSVLEARPQSIAKFEAKGLKGKEASYAASIFDLDASIGKLKEFLERSGLSKNTLLVFTSDNGATQESSQEPLRGNKGSYYEGGIREPFIAYWPGQIKPSVNDSPVINLDLYPTFLAMAGGAHENLDGENLWPVFSGKAFGTSRNQLFWHFPGYLNDPVIRGRDSIFRSRPVSVIRKGDWKLHLYHEEWLLDGGREKLNQNNAVELYNLKTDEGEHINLASKNSKKRDELLNDLQIWLKKTNAPMPRPLAKGQRLQDSQDNDIHE